MIAQAPAVAASPSPATPPQAPFGSSPAVQPTQNRGHEMAGKQKLALVVQQLTDILPLVGAASDIGQAVTDAIRKLAKHVQPGSVTPAAEKNQIEQMAIKASQNAQNLQAVRPPQPGSAPQQAA